MGILHIHAPQPDSFGTSEGKCLDCKCDSRFAWFHTPWYGIDSTCLSCGRSWSDGEWLPLPFVRGSRKQSIAQAERRLERLTSRSAEGVAPVIASEDSREGQ